MSCGSRGWTLVRHWPATAAAVALDGSGELTSPTDFSGSLNVRQLDGAGSYAVTGTADATRLRATLHLSEPAHGLLASLAGLPDLGAVAIDASLDGPRDAVVTRTTLAAGPHARHRWRHARSRARRRRPDGVRRQRRPCSRDPDIGWQAVAIDAHVRGPFRSPDAAGRMRIDALATAGLRIDRFTADIAGDAGRFRLDGEVTGLHVPGPNADLLASDPLTITGRRPIGCARPAGARRAAPPAVHRRCGCADRPSGEAWTPRCGSPTWGRSRRWVRSRSRATLR